MLRAPLGAWISALLLGGSSTGKPRFPRRVPSRLQILRPMVDPEGAIARSPFFVPCHFSGHKKNLGGRWAWGAGQCKRKNLCLPCLWTLVYRKYNIYTKSVIRKTKHIYIYMQTSPQPQGHADPPQELARKFCWVAISRRLLLLRPWRGPKSVSIKNGGPDF